MLVETSVERRTGIPLDVTIQWIKGICQRLFPPAGVDGVLGWLGQWSIAHTIVVRASGGLSLVSLALKSHLCGRCAGRFALRRHDRQGFLHRYRCETGVAATGLARTTGHTTARRRDLPLRQAVTRGRMIAAAILERRGARDVRRVSAVQLMAHLRREHAPSSVLTASPPGVQTIVIVEFRRGRNCRT
jgi:hypothetical protein